MCFPRDTEKYSGSRQSKTEKIYIEDRRGQSVGGMILSNNVTQNLGYYKYIGRLIVFFLGKLNILGWLRIFCAKPFAVFQFVLFDCTGNRVREKYANEGNATKGT